MSEEAPSPNPENRMDTIAIRIQAERERLMAETGLQIAPLRHWKRPRELPFSRAERGQVTVWFGGLTLRHEALIQAGLEGLGYRVGVIPTPRKADFQAGKEFGNHGQCNPTYFTVGALVNHLVRMRDEQAVPLERILRDHVFITAGACGPCRFGMYEAEYRLALRNSGFDGFRVLLFQQSGGLDQATDDAGIEFNPPFFISLLNAFFMGDLLNEVAYQIRPYETEPGKTNDVLARCVALAQESLRTMRYHDVRPGLRTQALARLTPMLGADGVAKVLDQLTGSRYLDVLARCRALVDAEIEVDFTRAKPVCKVTGEFWAQTTEGDGNFRMFSFLEGEGAEVLVEPVATWITYMLHQATKKARDRRGLRPDGSTPRSGALVERGRLALAYGRRRLAFAAADRIIGREYDRLRRALGGTAHRLVNQLELTRLGHPYYNSRAGGGEGHLEVAKNIYYANRDLCHMVLSLKPFGCMPSTQSDGAQAAVVSHFKDMIFLPLETSGEGDVNAHSRVQMALGEAKAKSREELARAVARAGYPLEQIRAYVARHRELRRPLRPVPHHPGVVGRAANFVLDVAARMQAEGCPR